MDEELLEPLDGYKKYYKDKFYDEANKYFLELKDKSEVNVEENKETIKEINLKNESLKKLKKRFNNFKGFNTFFTVLLIVGIIVAVFNIYLLASSGFTVLRLVLLILGIIFSIASILIKKFGLSKRIKKLEEEIKKLEEEIKNLISLAKKQMAPLNALFDWNIPVIITRNTIPTMELDQFFDAKKYIYLNKKYGLKNDDVNSSTVYVQSGSILGNPFIICKDYIMEKYRKRYSNSITIHWTTTVSTKDGTRTIHHSQTLTASVYAPAPSYYYATYLVYGNDAAPNLIFKRTPTDVENMSDKQIEKFVKKESKRLNKKETKALTDKDPKTNYSRFSNDEFETIFGGTDRNNDLEYNLLFTPLAQNNILKLLKDKEKIAYGDDFIFYKKKCLNLIQSEHSQMIDYRANPKIFMGYDYEKMYKFFIDFNTKWFKSFYFDLAPILSIPLYQTHKSKEYIYNEDILANLSPYEYEVMANQFDPSILKHKDSSTSNIYKTKFLSSIGDTDEFVVTAHSFKGERRVTIVNKMGGDGRLHSIPVHWIEYIPVEKDTNMIVHKNNQSRFDFNLNENPFKKYDNHFERGLLAAVGYDTLVNSEKIIKENVVDQSKIDLEKTIIELEKELDKKDLIQNENESDLTIDDALGEEKEVSADNIDCD